MAKHNYTNLAKQAGVSRPTIYKWLNEGVLDAELAKVGIRLEPGVEFDEEKDPPIEEVLKDEKPEKIEEWPIGSIKEEPQKIDGKIVFTRSYVRKSLPSGKLYWEGMRSSPEEIAWMEKASKKTREEINKRDPDSMVEGSLRSIDVISTGIPDLDIILGGGLAKGRMIEIYGANSTGKTTMALQIAAHFQSLGKKVAYMDAEQAIDKAYAKALGVNFDTLDLDQSSGMESTIEITRDYCRNGSADLVIVDSIAALLPNAEREGMAGDANMATKAKLMAQWCRMIPGNMAKKGVTVLFINQIRMFSQGGWGSAEYTPGGGSMAFAAFQRLKLRLVSEKDKTESRDVKVLCIKNKLSQPYEECELHLEYGKGFVKV